MWYWRCAAYRTTLSKWKGAFSKMERFLEDNSIVFARRAESGRSGDPGPYGKRICICFNYDCIKNINLTYVVRSIIFVSEKKENK